jgi:hypothetical protein
MVDQLTALHPATARSSTHSNLVHVIVQRLTGASFQLTDLDYDRLVVLAVTGKTRTVVVLRYGAK